MAIAMYDLFMKSWGADLDSASADDAIPRCRPCF